ncbi:MAG: hypothetical protein NTZ48_05695, partial [Candidatus Omnitrophica bacterium]|nr:hypothetical protein [Candidatus Omnitrophota bacterium]
MSTPPPLVWEKSPTPDEFGHIYWKSGPYYITKIGRKYYYNGLSLGSCLDSVKDIVQNEYAWSYQ